MGQGIVDIDLGLRSWRLWSMLGWHDILSRYRRSAIGPFWLTLSVAIFIGFLGFLYARIFGTELGTYLPYLAAGYVVWLLLSALVTESARAFMEAQAIIKQRPLPLSIYIYRVVYRNFLVFLHNALVLVPVMVIFHLPPRWPLLLAIPGLLLILVNGIWVGLIVAVMCARFRDIPQLIASLMQVAFFATPVIWMPNFRKDLTWFVDFNPFYHFIQLVRAPILGQAPTTLDWMVAIGLTICGWVAAAVVFNRFRNRIVYWL